MSVEPPYIPGFTSVEHTLRGAIRWLAGEADRAVFGPGDPTDEAIATYWTRIDEVRTRLVRMRGRWSRLRALVSLRSLRSPAAGRLLVEGPAQ